MSGWEPGTVFELENGQQWKVLKGSMQLRKPMQAPEIVVVPGIAGRWFLQVDEDLPKARVYRIAPLTCGQGPPRRRAPGSPRASFHAGPQAIASALQTGQTLRQLLRRHAAARTQFLREQRHAQFLQVPAQRLPLGLNRLAVPAG